MRRQALITGIGGQDGALLSALLLDAGYGVAGILRRDPSAYADNLKGIGERIEFVTADLLDRASLVAALEAVRPTEDTTSPLLPSSRVPGTSRSEPPRSPPSEQSSLLEAVRREDRRGDSRLYQASSSEIFGEPGRIAPDRGDGARAADAVRCRQGLRALHRERAIGAGTGCSRRCGILDNHESPRRPLDFLPRKVSPKHARRRSRLGLELELALGDLGARRDWGYARGDERPGDVADTLQVRTEPDDHVVATGERAGAVEDLVARAFEARRAGPAGATCAVTPSAAVVAGCRAAPSRRRRRRPREAATRLGARPSTSTASSSAPGRRRARSRCVLRTATRRSEVARRGPSASHVNVAARIAARARSELRRQRVECGLDRGCHRLDRGRIEQSRPIAADLGQ